MSANIKVTLSTSRLEVAAGESVEATIAISNQSKVVDEFIIKIEGLEPTWWTLSVPSVSLFPGDQDEAKLTIRPPKEAEARAGSYPFQVKAVSQANPQEAAVADAYLILSSFVIWEADMSPTKVVGQSGVYRIELNNHGNADIDLNFKGKDPEENLNYQFDREKVTVPAGESAQVNLTVQPKKGEAKKQYSFQVLVRPTGKKSSSVEIKALSGQLEYTRRCKLSWWILRVIRILIRRKAKPMAQTPTTQEASITAPKSGDSWYVGSLYNITWVTMRTRKAHVVLKLSIDNGKSWNTIITDTPNSGTYAWKVPDMPSKKCLIKVTVYGVQDEILARCTSSVFRIVRIPK